MLVKTINHLPAWSPRTPFRKSFRTTLCRPPKEGNTGLHAFYILHLTFYMTIRQHDNLNAIIACATLILGWLLTYIDYFLAEYEGVHQSVLWVLGQALTFAGALLGIKSYVDYRTSRDTSTHQTT